ncbi:hypothetical protein GCM10020000_04190 [Streptomyces olivoverticillatus]
MARVPPHLSSMGVWTSGGRAVVQGPVPDELFRDPFREGLDGRGDCRGQPGAQGTVGSLDRVHHQSPRHRAERTGQRDGLRRAEPVAARHAGPPDRAPVRLQPVDPPRMPGAGTGGVHDHGQLGPLPQRNQPSRLPVAAHQPDAVRQAAAGRSFPQPVHDGGPHAVVPPERVADPDDDEADGDRHGLLLWAFYGLFPR